jgi:hypothetical protein
MTITVTVDTVDYVFTQDSFRNDSSIYLESSSTLVLPRELTLKRVYPKRAGSFVGVARTDMRLSWAHSYTDAAGETVSAPVIWRVTSSRRADMPEAEFTKARGIVSALITDGELDAFSNNLSL